jgi:hypothetical protein
MRALIIHIGEGTTQILLTTTHREDLNPNQTAIRPNPLAEKAESKKRDEFYIMHDFSVRNGADLSLLHKGHLIPDLRETLLAQAEEALEKFSDVVDATTLAISTSLLTQVESFGGQALSKAALRPPPTIPSYLQKIQRQWNLNLLILHPDEEALWMLRGLRGIHPKGELGCISIGYWRTLISWERPGRVPQLFSADFGNVRSSNGEIKAALEKLPLDRGSLYLTGENAWVLGALKSGLTYHDAGILDSTHLSLEDVEAQEDLLLPLDIPSRNTIPMIMGRGEIVPEMISRTHQLIRASKLPQLPISSRGLAHGLASHLLFEGREAKLAKLAEGLG